MKRSAILAAVIVGTSLAAGYALDAVGHQQLAFYALLPVYPVLIAVVGAAGGFHSASGEQVWMVVAGALAFVLWWGLIMLTTKNTKTG